MTLAGATLDAAAATGRAAVRDWSPLTAARRAGDAFRSSARADEFAEFAEFAESAGAAEAGAQVKKPITAPTPSAAAKPPTRPTHAAVVIVTEPSPP
jgi:hypothetical protein